MAVVDLSCREDAGFSERYLAEWGWPGVNKWDARDIFSFDLVLSFL
jgi:hypothetical protein